MPVRYILLSVWVRLSIFSQLSIIQSIIKYVGLCVFSLPTPLVMIERIYIYTLSYYHHQTGSMNYYPLFRVRSWNNVLRCMSFYILIVSVWNFQELLPLTIVIPMQKIKVRGQRSWSQWCPYKRSRSNVAVTEVKTQFCRFRTVTPFWVHISWCNDAQSLMWHRSFSRSSVKFQGQKIPNLTRIGSFWTVIPVWIRRWLSNDAQSLI